MRAHCKQSKPNQSRGWAAPSPSTILTTLGIIQTIHHHHLFTWEHLCRKRQTGNRSSKWNHMERHRWRGACIFIFCFFIKGELEFGSNTGRRVLLESSPCAKIWCSIGAIWNGQHLCFSHIVFCCCCSLLGEQLDSQGVRPHHTVPTSRGMMLSFLP